MLIPHTLAVTTLGLIRPGDARQHRDRHAGQACAEAPRDDESPRESFIPCRPSARPSRISGACSPSAGIAPQRRLGQNFLIDLNIHDVIVKAAEVGPGDVILEVGPGTGALTSLMAAQGAAVVAVDVDPAMAKLTAEAVAGLPNVRVLQRDALAGKHA